MNSYTYFIGTYCQIYDSVDSDWIPFDLWPSQRYLLKQIHENQLTVILKARQLGISWISLAYALWSILFRPIAAVSLFSRRDNESLYMLSNDRLRGMYNHLPKWMTSGHSVVVNSGHEWILSSGSAVRAFPTSAGDGYVSTLAIVDEADLSPDLNKLMRSVKPTIDNGGKLILLSRSDKSQPASEFKNIYKGAKAEENGWKSVFLPWYAHPGRDAAWYERQKMDILSRTGSLDDLHEQYPATDEEALSARSLDKRIPPMWLYACYKPLPKLTRASESPSRSIPSIGGLTVYKPVSLSGRYVIGADPAEGNPTSDDSSLSVIDVKTGEEYACLSGKYEPAIFASYIAQISLYYNKASAMVERNNHGHSVIQWLEEHARYVHLLLGHDAETHKKDKKSRDRRKKLKKGWLSSTTGKAILYTIAADFFRQSANVDDPEEDSNTILHTEATLLQLCSIEGGTLRAPDGMMDDRADSFALALAGRVQIESRSGAGILAMAKTKGWGFSDGMV